MERRADRLARLERWTEWPLTVLALLLIPILFVPELFDLGAGTEAVFDALDYLIWGVFAADLLAKVAIAPDRARLAQLDQREAVVAQTRARIRRLL